MPAIRDASPQARHHFTRFDQVNQLVGASEADPDLGFMARLMALCSLPRTNPGNRTSVQARQRPLHAHHDRKPGEYKLPFGHLRRASDPGLGLDGGRAHSIPRVDSGSIRCPSSCGKLGVYSSRAAKHRTRLRNQMRRLFNAHVRMVYEDKHGEAVREFLCSLADRGEFWWDPKRPNERVLWDSKIELGEKFFKEIINHPVPLDMNTLTASSALRWASISTCGLVYRTFTPERARCGSSLAATLPSVRGGTRQTRATSAPFSTSARIASAS